MIQLTLEIMDSMSTIYNISSFFVIIVLSRAKHD